jgi:hypothetical protein
VARPKKIMTPAELRGETAQRKLDLKTQAGVIKDAAKAIKAAEAVYSATLAAAAKALVANTKTHDADVKAANKVLEAVQKTQGKIMEKAIAASEKATARLDELKAIVPVTDEAAPVKRGPGRPRKVVAEEAAPVPVKRGPGRPRKTVS